MIQKGVIQLNLSIRHANQVLIPGDGEVGLEDLEEAIRAALREAAEGALVIRDGEGKQILSDAALKTVVTSCGQKKRELSVSVTCLRPIELQSTGRVSSTSRAEAEDAVVVTALTTEREEKCELANDEDVAASSVVMPEGSASMKRRDRSASTATGGQGVEARPVIGRSWSMRVPGAKDVLDKRYVERVGSICSDGRSSSLLLNKQKAGGASSTCSMGSSRSISRSVHSDSPGSIGAAMAKKGRAGWYCWDERGDAHASLRSEMASVISGCHSERAF